MTPSEQAKELYKEFFCTTPQPFYTEVVEHKGKELKFNGWDRDWTHKMAKAHALLSVKNTVKALEDYGRQTDELQNMDREFAWWDEVEKEINKL